MFKPGDRVVVVNVRPYFASGKRTGDTARITHVNVFTHLKDTDPDRHSVNVQWDDGTFTNGLYAGQFALAQQEPDQEIIEYYHAVSGEDNGQQNP